MLERIELILKLFSSPGFWFGNNGEGRKSLEKNKKAIELGGDVFTYWCNNIPKNKTKFIIFYTKRTKLRYFEYD